MRNYSMCCQPDEKVLLGGRVSSLHGSLVKKVFFGGGHGISILRIFSPMYKACTFQHPVRYPVSKPALQKYCNATSAAAGVSQGGRERPPSLLLLIHPSRFLARIVSKRLELDTSASGGEREEKRRGRALESEAAASVWVWVGGRALPSPPSLPPPIYHIRSPKS